MNNCFLCEQSDVEMSLEHSIPQFLGGKKSDDKFKKMNLCKVCNSKLGTHVDARFARSFMNAAELSEFNGDVFLGRFTSIDFEENDEIYNLISENQYIEMMSNDKSVAFWLKENTAEFLGLVGGHAPLSKSKNSQLFLFLIKEDMTEDELIELLTDIRKKFKGYNKLEILLCLDFASNHKLGEEDLNSYRRYIESLFQLKGLKFLWDFSEKELKIKDRLKLDGKNFKSKLTFNLNDDVRFLSKLFLGILCGYLGNEFTEHPVGERLVNIIRTYSSRDVLSGDEIARLSHPVQNRVQTSEQFLLEEDSITISIVQMREDIIGVLGIRSHLYSLRLCKTEELSDEMKSVLSIKSDSCTIPSGIMLILKPDGEKYIECNVKNFFIRKFLDKKCTGMPEKQKLEILRLLEVC